MKNDWGPFPNLAEQLASITPGNSPGDVEWSQIAEEFGGLWGLLYKEGLWPSSLPPLLRQTSPVSYHGSPLHFVARLFGGRRLTVARVPLNQLEKTLTECHAWLGAKILREVAPLFSPFWNETPLRLAAVWQRGLAWTLMAYALDVHGFEKALRSARAGAKAKDKLSINVSFQRQYALDPSATPGDFLALHIHIEPLIRSIGSRLNLHPFPASGRRKPGGLRTSSFLSTYPALVRSGETREGRACLAAINLLIDNSPLTQMVYVDVVGRVTPQAVFGPLSKLGPDAEGWCELWLSHLARALVGVILSPPPVFEEWQEAENRCKQLEERARLWVLNRPFYGASRRLEDYPGLKRAREQAAQRRQQMASQFIERPGMLATLLSQGSRYLHILMLDMLVRQVVASSTEAMKRQQQTVKTQDQGPLRLAREIPFSDEGVCFRTFREGLCGEEMPSSLPQEQLDELRASLKTLLDAPLEIDAADPAMVERMAEELAQEAGVSKPRCLQLLMRFVDDKNHGVELPFRYPDDRGNAPMTILADWLAFILNRLPAVEVSVETVTEESPY